ncbi:unnamed protein product [Amoebophrya sp. A120]|nr:unnamed protein product [Amoebophrya sp. A120]|eukprot:GSA120T00016227001.1
MPNGCNYRHNLNLKVFFSRTLYAGRHQIPQGATFRRMLWWGYFTQSPSHLCRAVGSLLETLKIFYPL